MPVNEIDKERINQSLNIYDRFSASLLVNESASQFITSSLESIFMCHSLTSLSIRTPAAWKHLTINCQQKGVIEATGNLQTETKQEQFGQQLHDVIILGLKQWRQHWHSAQNGAGSITDLILDEDWINLFSTLHQEAFPHMFLFSPLNIKKPTLLVWSI